MTRIIVEVDGGVVQAIYSNTKNLLVELIDWDNMKAEPDATAEEDGLGEYHVGVFTDAEFEAKRTELIGKCKEIESENFNQSL